MKDIISIREVVYNPQARGPWCALPYPNHPKGCPNLKKCIKKNIDFKTIQNKYEWYAIMEEFDLSSHMKKMKDVHEYWTERQCRNPLYWQGGVRKKLREKTLKFANSNPKNIILEIPEASGVDVFETMKKVGIVLERTPNTVRKIMLVGVVK